MWGPVAFTLFLTLNFCVAEDWNGARDKDAGSRLRAEGQLHKPSSLNKRIVTWHNIQFPRNAAPNLREFDEPSAVTDDDVKDVLVCGPECKGYVDAAVTSEKANAEFAYEVFSDEGATKHTELELDKEFLRYLNRWQDGEKRLKRREEEAKSTSRRRRNAVIGDDTRFEITEREWLNQIPFSANVMLSTGCSGVLISEVHVLTAASCVHNGRKMIHKIRDIDIGVRQKRQLTHEEEQGSNWKDAFRWIPVKKVFVPKEWSSKPAKNQRGKAELPVDKNYALIQLKRKVDRPFLDISVGSVANVGEGKRVHFSSFDEALRPTVNYRFCKVMEETMEMIYQQCDGTPQSVGAGVYVRRWNPLTKSWDRKVVGIFTGHQIFYTADGTTRERNLAVKITPLKFAQICFWMTGDYGECRG